MRFHLGKKMIENKGVYVCTEYCRVYFRLKHVFNMDAGDVFRVKRTSKNYIFALIQYGNREHCVNRGISCRQLTNSEYIKLLNLDRQFLIDLKKVK